MPGTFDTWTILFSFSIATLAGFVAFESIDHMRDSPRPAVWTFVSGAMLGLGIWSMHFVGMLAWQPPFPLYYTVLPTVLSVLVAILSSWLAMHITVSHQAGASQRNLIGGALLVGLGICTMHYLGMCALHFTQPVMWSWPGVGLSFLIAVLASLGAMAMMQRSQSEALSLARQTGASLVIGLAICGMHYTGMLAMMLPAGAVSIALPGSFSGPVLARIGVGNSLLFMACLLVVFQRDKVRLMRLANEARFALQEAARNSERLVTANKIAATISHEINNPLEAVTNLLYLAESGMIGDTERTYIQAAQTEIRRIAEITTHTLKFYRNGNSLVETKLPDLFESALVVFDKRLTQAGIKIEKHWASNAPAIVCRPGEIRQVFANLVSNAMDAMPNGGLLWVAVLPCEGGACVEVADSGTGIPEDARAHILEPFFTTKGLSGTGLGLALCAEIVQRHNGRLDFMSNTAPGRSGTKFTLFLPTRGATSETAETSSGSSQPARQS
ncbi:MHYT domain-containing protein [Terriglobus roseus]|uniref:histidine kinase n=1 Tax=Terriglobus roseus TaxID=392734 RepID=A0A1H4PW63_9BACT|nr:MHYT domain-containing protein [Terriglobus roseus]SEC11639.1 MHYT domain-containing protein, NO-binding membrane sensor [Terriglobus roseus]